LLIAAGCADAPEVPLGPDGEPDAQLLVGRDLYASRCAVCHGTNGQGGRGPTLRDGAVLAAYPDPADMAAVVTNGLNQGMPAFGDALSAEEIDAVVAYVRDVLG
jgi:mono/diheme cytochrome c family protein